MPRDGYRTQVLLLHSEQSTLDHLSSGFDDNFTVHCATSGSEALNTLVDTPINVIVTAQDLPGMSGLEALREARKRSPETIGILLAGDDDEGLEALVGVKEVFQVVRGNVSGDAISKLVENATQQMRLAALANSANDAAADVDEDSAEHIVMETSENGASIITDGTGRMRALTAANESASSALGAHSVDLLVLTKDSEFLATIKDSSRGTHSVHYASTLAQADALIREYKVGVAVVDAAMVGEKIEQLTAHLRKGSPRIVSVVAGRRDDGEMMMDLINRSKIYRFLLKPVSPGRARLAIEASVKHHLEAPEAAFQMKVASEPSATATMRTAQPKKQSKNKKSGEAEAKAKPKEAANRESKSESKAAADVGGSSAAGAEVTADRRLASGSHPAIKSLDDSVAGEVDASFTETVTGLLSTLGKKTSGDEKSPQPESGSLRPESAPARASSGRSFLKSPKMLGIGAVALVVLAGAVYWFTLGIDETARTVTSPVETRAATESAAVVDDEISRPDLTTDDALATGSTTGADSDGDVVALVDRALLEAEAAMLESRIEDAGAALDLVSEADPDNSRLPFLTAQLSQLKLREVLNDARTAIRELRFEDASLAIEQARLLTVADSSEIDAAEDELTVARSAQQTEDVLAMANARLDDGDLLAPPNDNARYYFELALENDPGNAVAQQGLGVIASKLALQSRSETDNGNLDSAEALLVDATALDPNNSELAAAVTALADKREAIVEQRRQAEQRRRAEAERRAAEERAAAEREAEKQRAAAEREAEKQRAATAQPVKEAAELPAEASTGADTVEPTAADATSIEQKTVGESESTAAAEDSPPPAATQKPVQQAAPTTVAVSALNRTKYVAPKYPRAAQRRNLSGWVDVVFTVDTSGSVKDVEARDSEPGETFVAAAIRAVEKWQFEPVVENGQAVEKRAGVRMMFAIE